LVALEQAGSFSGFYTGETAQPRLERVLSLGYHLEMIQRRHQLVQARFGGLRPSADPNSSVRDWFNFLGLKEPIRCLDVGALGLGGESEPWVRWAQEGCAEVLGFEPLQNECEQLNLKAQQSGAAIRYLPWALGDGLEHTLHITNAPMTSSLYPPARSTIDLFPALGELMQVEEKMRIQTHRLDDIEEAVGTDFLKLDVQGAELMILKNAPECLQNVSVIQCEVEFVELYEGQPLMADVDAFLRSQGFCFLRFAYTMGRAFKPLKRADSPCSAISQMLWADALYVRDFRRLDLWRERQLRAGAFILHEAYEAYDFVLLILQELARRGAGELPSCYATVLMLMAEGKLLIDG
jgi:FkbM family methyltransferase